MNDVRLHYAAAGSGPPVVLLHGFPDFWFGWRHQIRALSAAGYRAIAPDLRGYNRSERPPDVRSYALQRLVDDVAELIEAMNAGPVTLVGHDWGGGLAWYLAMHSPHLLERLVIINAAHPAAYMRELRRPSSQVVRSLYFLFFQVPRLPEWLLRLNDLALLRSAWRRGPAPSENDLAHYYRAFAARGALTGGLNYYRAALRYRRPPISTAEVPTLVIWGEQDVFQSPALLDGLGAWVPDLRIERLPNTGHWPHHTHTERCNEALLSFLRAS